jgi:hypothetical protein
MTRLILIILLSISAGILIRATAHHFTSPPPTAELHTSPDIAVQLRALSSAPQPAKPWATDFAAYVSTHPGQWLVGHCSQPCLSEPEAARQARTDAANSLWPIIAARLPQPIADADWLRDRLTSDVLAGRLDADILAEQFQRPYGVVWTDSVLLDISPARLDPLLNSYHNDLSDRQNHHFQFRKAIVVAMVAAWLAYLFLNALTKGYFTTPLRFAAALITVAGTAFLV